MQYHRNQRCIISNNLAQHYKEYSLIERKELVAEAKYHQTHIARSIKDLRQYRQTGQLPTETSEDTDIEQMTNLEELLRMRSNARSNLSKARKADHTQRADKWEKILFRIEQRIGEITETP